MAVIPTLQAAVEFPWKEASAITFGGAMLWVLYYVMKSTREQHKECNATIEKVSGDFAKSTKEAAEQFSETAQILLRDAREYHERREDKIMSLLADKQE